MISYEPLFRLMKSRNITVVDIDPSLVSIFTHTINKNRFTTTETIQFICEKLQCNIEDVIEYVPGEQVYITNKWVNVNWDNLNCNLAEASRLVGKSNCYLGSLKKKDSKMKLSDLEIIAVDMKIDVKELVREIQ